MIIELSDWCFQVDVDATLAHTTRNSADHCSCAYCRNYYEAVDQCYPALRSFLDQFGVNLDGPSELMPFTPTLLLACYRIHGKVLQWGREAIWVNHVQILPELSDNNDTFFLWVGEMALSWLQEEDMDEVVSPANLPEFLERMQEVWLQRHGETLFFS